jgi:pimeloyl-ACP methyl ester carboxylesterase
MQPSRHFISVGAGATQRWVHYTRAGDGPPVLLLHASATSSGEMALAQSVFARDFTAIAFDTPGYGLSEPLRLDRAPQLEDYADGLTEVLDALGVGPAAAYGRHTGASIAVEFGRRHPSLCTMVLTDGYPIWTADERERMLGGYLPALVPSWDGAHLLWSWFRYRDQHVFWPWFDWRAEKRATRDVPPLEFLQRGALEFLLAGDGYRVGYSAAFRHDGGLALDGITVPVCLGTRSSDLIHPMRDRAPPQSWRIEAPTDPLAAAVMERELLHQHPAPVRPFIAPPCLPVPGRASPDFLAVGDSRLLMRRVFGTGETILIIPEIPGSTAWLAPLLDALPGPAIAFDLPGLGESDVDGEFVPSVEDWAHRLFAALDAAGVGRVRIYAHRGGCAVAVAMALAAPDRVGALLLDAPLCVPDAVRVGLVETYAPDVSLSWDGSHMIRVWHHLRDQEFWWPWFDRRQAAALPTDPAIDPTILTIRAAACLRQPRHYRAAWQAIWRYDLLTGLALVIPPVAIAASPGEAFGHLAGAAAALAGRPVAVLPDDIAAKAAAITAALAIENR